MGSTIVWPSSVLPAKPLRVGSISETTPNIVVRTQMDAGPAKVRRRFTAGVRPFKLGLNLNSTELDFFDTFFVTTLQGGALSFNWTHPRSSSTGEFRFVGQPVYSPLGSTLYHVEFDVELLP